MNGFFSCGCGFEYTEQAECFKYSLYGRAQGEEDGLAAVSLESGGAVGEGCNGGGVNIADL